MITKEYSKIEYPSRALKKSYVKVGFTSAAALLLLILLSTTEPPSSSTTTAFAQEQGNDSNASASTSTTSTTSTATNTTEGLNSTLVDFASNIEQIRGHLNAAVMNKEAGNSTLAEVHTLHPIAEIYSSIEPQISNANASLNETLATNLNQLSEMVNTSSIDKFDTQSQKINGLLNQTVQQAIPSETANNNIFKLGIVSNLLSIAGVEYGEAVENGSIKEIVEYQDGQAFISKAQDVFGQASSIIPQEMDPEIEETKQLFSDLNNAIQNKSSPEIVDRSIGAIIYEISEITGISEESLGGQPAGTESGETISEIRNLLKQTVEAYQQQNYAEAEAHTTTAYLEHFEFIEAPLAEKDEVLMENTEGMLREQLRQLIQNKVLIEELQQHIDKININLDKAEKLIGGVS
jgi:hypothetical protein